MKDPNQLLKEVEAEVIKFSKMLDNARLLSSQYAGEVNQYEMHLAYLSGKRDALNDILSNTFCDACQASGDDTTIASGDDAAIVSGDTTVVNADVTSTDVNASEESTVETSAETQTEAPTTDQTSVPVENAGNTPVDTSEVNTDQTDATLQSIDDTPENTPESTSEVQAEVPATPEVQVAQ